MAEKPTRRRRLPTTRDSGDTKKRRSAAPTAPARQPGKACRLPTKPRSAEDSRRRRRAPAPANPPVRRNRAAAKPAAPVAPAKASRADGPKHRQRHQAAGGFPFRRTRHPDGHVRGAAVREDRRAWPTSAARCRWRWRGSGIASRSCCRSIAAPQTDGAEGSRPTCRSALHSYPVRFIEQRRGGRRDGGARSTRRRSTIATGSTATRTGNYGDNAFRFAVLCRGALEYARLRGPAAVGDSRARLAGRRSRPSTRARCCATIRSSAASAPC